MLLVVVVASWQTHFASIGVLPQDIAALAAQIDRPFLRQQRAQWC